MGSMDPPTVQRLGHWLTGDSHELRAKFATLLQHPVFVPRYDVSLATMRTLAYKRLKLVCGSSLVSITDFETDPLKIFAGEWHRPPGGSTERRR